MSTRYNPKTRLLNFPLNSFFFLSRHYCSVLTESDEKISIREYNIGLITFYAFEINSLDRTFTRDTY